MENSFFECDDFYVVDKRIAKSDNLVVTFSAYSPSKKGSPFGLSFLLNNNLSALHVVSQKNIWFHSEKIIEFADKVKKEGKEVFLYGASMGGYASLHFRKLFGATSAIAISPQCFIIDKLGNFDPRWSDEQLKINPIFCEKSNLTVQNAPAFIFYDRFHKLDNAHIELFKNYDANDSHYLNVPYGEHNCARLLVQANILKNFISSHVNNKVVDIERLEFECLNSFVYDSKSFFKYFREFVKDVKDKRIHLLRHLFEYYLEREESFDFEEFYLVAEVFLYLKDKERAVAYSLMSIKKYPSESSLPDYIFLKHLHILRQFIPDNKAALSQELRSYSDSLSKAKLEKLLSMANM